MVNSILLTEAHENLNFSSNCRSNRMKNARSDLVSWTAWSPKIKITCKMIRMSLAWVRIAFAGRVKEM